MNLPIVFLIYIAIGSLLGSCASLPNFSQSSYDQKILVFRTYNLFNQRIPPNHTNLNWKGDWIFRRERLELIDRELRLSRPDVLLFQQMLTKDENSFESDQNILAEGSLSGYEWSTQPVVNHEDTSETESHGLVYSLPLRLVPQGNEKGSIKIFPGESKVTHNVLAFENEPITIFNIEIKRVTENLFAEIAQYIFDLVNKKELCLERVLIGGYFGETSPRKIIDAFQKYFPIKNVSTGFCEIEIKCYTSTPFNELFLVTTNINSSYQSDYFFTHNKTIIFTSNIVFEKGSSIKDLDNKYGMSKFWGSRTFGLETGVKLKKCRQK